MAQLIRIKVEAMQKARETMRDLRRVSRWYPVAKETIREVARDVARLVVRSEIQGGGGITTAHLGRLVRFPGEVPVGK